MKLSKIKSIFFILSVFAVSCESETLPKEDVKDETVTEEEKPKPEDEQPKPEGPYSYLEEYDVLKSYVNPNASADFRLGAAIEAGSFNIDSEEYKIVSSNFEEVTAGNAMKQASVMKPDGSMDFTTVRRFVERAEESGMTVYGHTLAWHSQQQNAYLNSLIQGKKVEVPSGSGDEVLLETDFNDGSNPFNGWGNNSTRKVENGVLKLSNPSVTDNWAAQFAKDFNFPFVSGQEYQLKFKVKGSANGSLSAGLQITSGYISAGEFGSVNFTTQWKDVEMTCKCTADGATRLVFSFGAFAGDIYIDDFKFSAIGVSYTYEPMTPEAKKEALVGAMDRWIDGMMEATATKVSVWDVVNEPISSRDTNGDGFYELESAQWGSDSHFFWQDYLGSEDYVRIVVEKARKYYAEHGGTDPLLLFINDYNLESDWDDNKKLKSLIHWIGIWESDGVTKIDGIGTQMHVSCYENQGIQNSKKEHVVQMLELMVATGKLVKISELDMGYVDKNGNTVATVDMQEYQHKAMAEFYEFIVSKYFEIVPPAQQYGICQWCPFDAPGAIGTGWRGGEPVGLWDSNYNRKHTYAGFADGLKGE